ncbi:MAG: hypothetical protein ACRD47_15355, partial [Nitrososphaeraceae archaeon]
YIKKRTTGTGRCHSFILPPRVNSYRSFNSCNWGGAAGLLVITRIPVDKILREVDFSCCYLLSGRSSSINL